MPTISRLAWIDAWEKDLTPSAAATRAAARTSARMRSARYYGREANARLPQPEPENLQQKPLPELKVVTRRKRHWGVALLVALIAGVVLGTMIIAPVLVSSAATGIEAQVGQLEAQQEELSTATSGLAARISAMSSPDRIAEQAAQLGLGPAQSVQYMSAGDEPVGTEGDTTVAGR